MTRIEEVEERCLGILKEATRQIFYVSDVQYLLSLIKQKDEALKRYADKKMWASCNPHPDIGEVQYFDWVNKPHDYENAWEIAEEALALGHPAGNFIRKA